MIPKCSGCLLEAVCFCFLQLFRLGANKTNLIESCRISHRNGLTGIDRMMTSNLSLENTVSSGSPGRPYYGLRHKRFGPSDSSRAAGSKH
jgi:hypothetical protein